MRSISFALFFGFIVFLVGSRDPAFAQTPPASDREELARLRSDLEALRGEYAERIAALEQRLSALQAAAPTAPPSPARSTSPGPRSRPSSTPTPAPTSS